MNVILADDEPQVRSAIRLLLEQESQVQITVESDNLADLINALAGLDPNLLLLDWEMSAAFPRSQLIDELRQRYPSLKVIAMSGRPEARAQAILAGADGFVSKGDPPEALLMAVLKICA